MAHLVLIAAIVFATLAGGGGLAYAADAAGPGDPLYGIDRALESVQLALTPRAQRPALLLAFAKERLEEAEALPGIENVSRREVALNGWGEAISTLATSIAGPHGIDEDALAATIDAALARQEGRLSQMLAASEPEQEDDDRCVGAFPHPVVQRLADAYEDIVDYDTVLEWFCDGYGLGEIMLALETARATGEDPGDLLGEKTALGGWGLVWQDLGLIGRPDDPGPPEGVLGKPDDPGPPEGVPGKPDDPGPPEGVPGKPDDPGPPEGVPPGRPDDPGPPVKVPPVDPPVGDPLPIDPPEPPVELPAPPVEAPSGAR